MSIVIAPCHLIIPLRCQNVTLVTRVVATLACLSISTAVSTTLVATGQSCYSRSFRNRSRARGRGCKRNCKSWANSIRTACAVETGHACSHCLVSIRLTKCIDTQESATPLSNVESQLEMLQGFKTRCDRPSYDPSTCHCSSNSGNG